MTWRNGAWSGREGPTPWYGGPTLPLAILVLVLFLMSLAVGPVSLSLGDVANGLTGRGTEAANIIVRELRLPRALLALLIGGTLGLAGAAMQGLMRNPLASPDLFGAPSAAACAAVAVISIGLTTTLSIALPIAAIIGAFASVALLVLVAGSRSSLLVLMLVGLAIGSLASAGTSLALNLAHDPSAALEIAFWLLGSLQDRSMEHVAIAFPFLAISWVLLMWDRSAFRALTLGEDAAESLGISMRGVRLRVVTGVAAGVGAAVAVAGSIGFIGLVAPNLVRPFARFDPSRLLIPSALAGAAFLLASDIVVRLIPTVEEIKVGVITTLIGAPVFVFIIMRRQRALLGAAA